MFLTSMLFLIQKNPENEGKVFMYRYGKKIFEMLKEAISPALRTKRLSIRLILDQKVQTLKSKSEKLMVIGTTTSQSLIHKLHFLKTKTR